MKELSELMLGISVINSTSLSKNISNYYMHELIITNLCVNMRKGELAIISEENTYNCNAYNELEMLSSWDSVWGVEHLKCFKIKDFRFWRHREGKEHIIIYVPKLSTKGFPWWLRVKNPPATWRTGFNPRVGRIP